MPMLSHTDEKLSTVEFEFADEAVQWCCKAKRNNEIKSLKGL